MSAPRKFVIIESPYAGDIDKNIRYARICLRDSILRGETPFASHLLYTQDGVLNDSDPIERALGIELGLSFGAVAGITAVYTDLGISDGMRDGIIRAISDGRPVVYRSVAVTI